VDCADAKGREAVSKAIDAAAAREQREKRCLGRTASRKRDKDRIRIPGGIFIVGGWLMRFAQMKN